jgi:uncharacterized membrane protein YbaN (DUF454 family)
MAVRYFSKLSHEWQEYRKNVTEHKMRVLIVSTINVRNISHSKNNSAIYYHICTYIMIYVHISSRKVPVILDLF